MSEETHGEGQGGGCLFCKIISGEIPSKKVYSDENIFSFLDINPRNPGHALVIPKKHYTTILDMPGREVGKLFEGVRMVASAVKNGSSADGLSIVQSNGKAAGQVVTHVHVHIIPRYMSEGPISLEGVMSVKKMPEEVLDKMVTAIKAKIGSSAGSSGEPKFDF
ncbi:MAG: HIT family protein [Candidatus Aenigmarchaeota archaeon]|nr:HIT family protein [Candidatus Aenigmarchaeota archaeon]